MRCLPLVVCPSCYNTTCQQSWHAPLAVKAFCTTETSQVFTTPPPTPPTIPPPCHHPFVLPLPLPACLIYKLQTYSGSKIAVLVKSTDRISHTITEHDFTNHSIDSLQSCCRQTHTLMMPTGHVCLKASKASFLWFHIGCTTSAPLALIMWVRLYDFTVQGHDCEYFNVCLLLCVWKMNRWLDWVWMLAY